MAAISLKPATPVYSSALQTQSLSAGLLAGEASASTKNSGLEEFRQLMTIMLMGMSMSGEATQGGLSGLGTSELMAPLMLSLLEKLLAGQVETEDESDTVKATTQPAAQSEPQGMPIKGHLTQGSHSGHVALDIGAPVGTQVHTTMGGKVVYAGWNNEGYGNLVIIENGPYRTYYAHLSEIPVKVGQVVEAGKVIGLSGNTGNSTGPHLHYEVRRNGQQINPTSFTLKDSQDST